LEGTFLPRTPPLPSTYAIDLNSSYTYLFISPSGVSEIGCATTKTNPAERSVSTERERHSKFLSYRTGARCILSAVSVLVVVQPISEVPEGLMNNPV